MKQLPDVYYAGEAGLITAVVLLVLSVLACVLPVLFHNKKLK